MQALKNHLQANASPTFALPPTSAAPPTVRWSGPVVSSLAVPISTLTSGVNIPVTDARIGGPIRDRLVPVSGNPVVNGYPCVGISRPYTCRGQAQGTSSPGTLRLKTNAAVIELTGVVPEGSAVVPVLIVNGELVPPVALAASRGVGGGWTAGTLVVDFGTRSTTPRDIWIETSLSLAYITIDALDTLSNANDQSEPQVTFVGDSYLQARSNAFAFDGAIALDLGARLGLRKVAVDAVGGTGYYNTNANRGNLNDRLPATVLDESIVYFVMAGLNDYYDATGWPTRADYEQSVHEYLQNLRAAQPNALIVVTAPFCPIPPFSDTQWKANTATNTSALGDYQYKAQLHKNAVQQIAGPWIYIDVLMGTGWLNSTGATGGATNLQWFTGGNTPYGTPFGGGGGFGGITSVPVMSGGHYSLGPSMTASGGDGEGLLLSGVIDGAGTLTSITVHGNGHGYTSGAGLPTITIDPTYQITPAVLGTPVLSQAYSPGSSADYPLPANAPIGATDLNNIDRLLTEDRTHPSPIGVEYLGQRLAENLYHAIMAL